MKYTTIYVKYDALGMVLEELKFFDEREAAECKGADVANQQRQQELDLQRQAINQQNAQQAYVKSLVQPFVTGSGQGYDPAQLAALQTQFLGSNDQAFNNAGQQLRTSLLSRGAGGGNMPVSGQYIKGLVGLDAARANSQQQGLTGINLQNLQTALNNRWNALSVLNGQPAQLDTQINASTSGANSALNAYITAANQGFGNAFTTGLGSALGKGIGSGLTGLASGGLGSLGLGSFGAGMGLG